MFRSITSSNGGGVQSQKKDLTPKQILHEINKYKYKNFSFEVALSDRSVKKIVVSLAASLFQGHEQGKLTEEKFNEYIQNAVKEIVEKDHYMGALPPGKTEEQTATDVLQQGLRDVFGHILNSGRNDDLSRLIDNFSDWSGNANTPVDSSMSAAGMTRAALTAIRSKSMSGGREVQSNPQYSTTQATLQLYRQQWLTHQSFSTPAPALAPVDVNSSLSSPEVSSETIQGKVKLALDSNPHGQILLSINNNQELKEFIELTCTTDSLTDKSIVVDLNLALNDESERLLHNINVNTKDLIFRTDIKQAAKLTEILKKRREGTQEALLETLRSANPHMQFIEAASLIPNFYSQTSFDSSLLDSEIPRTKVGFSCKLFYDVQVISLENDFKDKSISEILLIKKNGNTNQFELLDKVLKEKHLEKADFITANYNELVESLSSCITTVNDEASRQKIAALFIKSNVLALSGIESHSFEKLSDDEFAAYVLNEHLLKSSFDEIIEKKSSSLSVSVDAYLPNANSSEQFSEALRERFTRVPKTDDATYLMLDFKLNNQDFIYSLADKFNGYYEAKSFVNEYFEQRFQLFGINSEKPDSKVIFKEFLEKTQGNYGITEQNLLEVIRSCEKHFADNNFPAIPAAIQDYLTPKDMVIEQFLTRIFSYPFFTGYSEEQKSLYIDLQQQSQKSSDGNYITMNLFKKYFENPVKIGYPSDFRGFAFESLMMIASIDSYLERGSDFKYEPDLTKISTDKSFQVGSEVLNSPETLLTNILPPLDKKFIHDLPGYNQITNQVKSAFIDTLLGNSSFEVACDTLAKLLQDSIPSKETLLTVPVDEAFDPGLYSRVISNNGTEAQVLAVPPRASNDELFKKILEQCEFHLGDFAFQANLSTDKLQAVFNNSSFGKILETFTGGDLDAQQTLRKQIISTDLERNFLDKLFSDLISPNSYEIFNERDIKQQFLFAQLEQSENSTEILARINQLYEFITKTDSKDSSYQCVNGLVLDVEYHANCYQRLKQITEPAAIKQALFDSINPQAKILLDTKNRSERLIRIDEVLNLADGNLDEAAKLGINFDKYKEFRIDILLMQRKGASEEEIKEFVKLNLVSVFDTLPENNAENIKAIWQVVKNIDSKLTSDMRVFSLSSLNLEPSIQIALDTPPVNKNQMQAALETAFAKDENLQLPDSVKNIDAPEIQFYLETQKLATEMRSADPSSTDEDINNAVFLKLATYINQAAKEANINDFNLLALRDTDVPFVHNLLLTLESSNKALDSYFTYYAGGIFGASLQDVFQPLNLAITEEMKLHKDNPSLVNAYVDLCSGFNTKAPSSPQLDRTVNLQNLQLIEEFKTKYYQQNPQDEYDAVNPAYLKALQGLDERYSSIVKASGNVPTMENIISLVERSNLEFASIVQVVKEERLSSLLASSGEPPDSDSVNRKIKNTETAVDQYTTLQLLYRESPAFLENYIDNMIDGALDGGSGKAQNILKVLGSIITSLDSDFVRKFSAYPLANFTPLLDTYQEIRQKQNSKLYS